MKNKRKGFTIVELVIVIAVIAILASVLVPTFSGVILKAQRSADTQVVRMLNEDVAIDLAQSDKNKHDTMYDAVQACVAMGVSPDRISAKSDYNIAWESSSGRFVLIDPVNQQVMYPQSDDTYDIYDITGKEIDYFIVTTYDNRIEEDETFKYSVYAYGKDWPTELTIHAGFDAGDVKGFEKITFENDAERKDVIIRTNEFKTILEINGKVDAGLDGDNVKHYGYAAEVNIKSIGSASYHEFGVVGRLTVNKGHVVIEDYAEVFCLMEVAANAGDVDSTDVNLYATVYQGEIKTSKAHTENVSKCADGSHEYCKYVEDNKNVYDVCKYCGYTLIKGIAQNEPTALGNVVSSSNSNDDEHVHSFTKEVKTAATCKKVGVMLNKCSCGLSYESEIEKVDHSYAYTSNKNGTHNAKCSSCKDEIKNETCDKLGTNGACSKCGYQALITFTIKYTTFSGGTKTYSKTYTAEPGMKLGDWAKSTYIVSSWKQKETGNYSGTITERNKWVWGNDNYAYYIYNDLSYYKIKGVSIWQNSPGLQNTGEYPNDETIESFICTDFKDGNYCAVGQGFGYDASDLERSYIFTSNSSNMSSETVITSGMEITLWFMSY